MRTYFVTTPRLAHQVLVTDCARFRKGAMFDKFQPYPGNGLLLSNGPFHLRQRRLVRPAFHREVVDWTRTRTRDSPGTNARLAGHERTTRGTVEGAGPCGSAPSVRSGRSGRSGRPGQPVSSAHVFASGSVAASGTHRTFANDAWNAPSV